MEIKANATHGIVNREVNTFFRYQGWPSVCRDDEGVLYAVSSGMRVGHVCPFGKTLLYRSYDNGITWSIPMIVNNAYLDERDVGIVCLGGKRLLITWFDHPISVYLDTYKSWIESCGKGAAGFLAQYPDIPEEYAKGGSYVRISQDGGYTWGDVIQVPISSPHGPTMLKDGSLLYLGKQMYSDELAQGTMAAYRSADGGLTWEKQGELTYPDGTVPNNFHEPHAIELPDGRLLGMIRAEGAEIGKFTVYQTESSDGGKTWSPMTPTGFLGSPPHLLLHSSGAIICSYGRRVPPFGQRASVSYDGGKTWPDEYILRDDGDTGDLGYPCTVELPDGELLTVYYQAEPGDNFPSVLYTRWSLEK